MDVTFCQLKDLWRGRVDDAAREYERARFESVRAMERIGCGATDQEVDRLLEAHRQESAALDEYMRVLRSFHQLTVVKGEKGNA